TCALPILHASEARLQADVGRFFEKGHETFAATTPLLDDDLTGFLGNEAPVLKLLRDIVGLKGHDDRGWFNLGEVERVRHFRVEGHASLPLLTGCPLL